MSATMGVKNCIYQTRSEIMSNKSSQQNSGSRRKLLLVFSLLQVVAMVERLRLTARLPVLRVLLHVMKTARLRVKVVARSKV